MIFIGLFGFIAIVIVALNMFNSSNLETIEEYIKSQNCGSIIYAKGSYKSLCEDKILEISNSFTVDIEKNSKIYNYDKITNIEIQNLDLVINDNIKIKFSTKDEVSDFYDKLKEKLK